MLDEPTSFLDIRYKLELLTVLKQLVREKQVAVILSLHEIDLAQKLSDRLICVHNGRIERCGTPEQVFTGDYIRTLYDLERGTYNEQFGSLELERVTGEPRVFVIGGGGSLYGSAEMRSAVWICSVRSTKKTACCATGHSRRGCCGANRNWKILHDNRLKCCSKRNVVVK